MATGRHRVEVAGTVLALSITLLFILWLVLHLGGDGVVRYFDDVVTALAALSGCVSCLLAARRQSGAQRRFWVLLGLALAAWTTAEVIWAVYDLVLKVAVPVPSWADVGYLTAIPLAAAALLSQPGMYAKGTQKARASLDALAIGTALLLLSWTFVLGPLWRHTDLSSAGGVVALAYPFGDLVILFLIVLSMRSLTASGRRPLLWVMLGLFAMAVSDSTYAYLVEAGRYSTGNIVDAGWVLAYLSIAVGASWDSGEAVRVVPFDTGEASLTALVTPYVPILLGLAVITVKLELHGGVDRFSWLAGVCLALLAICRQALLIFDNREDLFPPGSEPKEPIGAAARPPTSSVELLEAAPWPRFVRRLP